MNTARKLRPWRTLTRLADGTSALADCNFDPIDFGSADAARDKSREMRAEHPDECWLAVQDLYGRNRFYVVRCG